MERLTKRATDGTAYLPYAMNIDARAWPLIDKLADYEDAEKQGHILMLPCSIGDTAYCVLQKEEDYVIEEFRVRGFVIDGAEITILLLYKFMRRFYIGCDVHLSLEEAQKEAERREAERRSIK